MLHVANSEYSSSVLLFQYWKVNKQQQKYSGKILELMLKGSAYTPSLGDHCNSLQQMMVVITESSTCAKPSQDAKLA
jgi:hypothetical protein